MSATAVVWVVIIAVIAVVTVVVTLLLSSRVGRRGAETPEDQYRREFSDLHSSRNRRAKRGDGKKRRRTVWAAGTVGAVGTDGGGCGGGGSGHGGGGGS
jgi:hypothetical protein